MQRKHFDVLVSTGAVLVAVVLVVLGIYFTDRHNYADTTVHDQLSAQKIFFPPKDKLSAEELKQPGVVANAGKQVVSGDQAEIYANQFIALHLTALANGKTYSQLSEESRANPDDQKLAGLVATAFKGTTLRGLLLSTSGFSQLGDDAALGLWVSFIAAGFLIIFAGLGYFHALRARPEETV